MGVTRFSVPAYLPKSNLETSIYLITHLILTWSGQLLYKLDFIGGVSKQAIILWDILFVKCWAKGIYLNHGWVIYPQNIVEQNNISMQKCVILVNVFYTILQSSYPLALMLKGISEWVIKFDGLSGDSRRGPYSPYKLCNRGLYIGMIIFPHLDNTQSTGHD